MQYVAVSFQIDMEDPMEDNIYHLLLLTRKGRSVVLLLKCPSNFYYHETLCLFCGKENLLPFALYYFTIVYSAFPPVFLPHPVKTSTHAKAYSCLYSLGTVCKTIHQPGC